jgi:hypothetical protein
MRVPLQCSDEGPSSVPAHDVIVDVFGMPGDLIPIELVRTALPATNAHLPRPLEVVHHLVNA